MDINATLLVQMVVFAGFIGLTVKFIWPPLMNALETRRKNIADGLAAAERGHQMLELSEIKAREQMTEAKAQAAHIIEQANQRALHIIEGAKSQAREEGERLLTVAKNDIEQEYYMAREKLMKQVSTLIIAGAEKVLEREIDKASNDHLIANLADEIK